MITGFMENISLDVKNNTEDRNELPLTCPLNKNDLK
jgi:hypothetical protein